VGQLLGLLGISFASALVPVVNIEAYLTVLASASDDLGNIWVLGLVAALGQMIGKMIWFYIGRNALEWGWIRRKVDRPKAQQRLATWRTRTQERPLVAGLLVFASALSGFPPFAIVAVLAGQLRMSAMLFFGLGTAGRWLRFAGVLGGASWLSALVG